MAVLVDPDRSAAGQTGKLADAIRDSDIDLVLVGGSLMITDYFEACISELKQQLDIPVVIFPGHPVQISAAADALLLLSLISGRNPELLIGHHVNAAPALKKSGLELLPTGYMLIDGGRPTAVSYISNTQPIPRDKPEIAVCTALAGEMLGLRNIYLEAGSGAEDHVPLDVISAVRTAVQIPIIAGGGIRKPETAQAIAKAGADLIVVGTALEQEAGLMRELASAVREV
jgi:putative glycerol-1-phosphate prenyltransferase